jgi:hypothetical protein
MNGGVRAGTTSSIVADLIDGTVPYGPASVN